MIDLSGKVILITGASSGIGRACAILAAKSGAALILIGRDIQKLELVRQQLGNGNHLFYSLDITKYDDIEPIIQDAVSKVGKISGFIQSAGVENTKPLQVMKPGIYENMFATNVFSGFEIARIISRSKYISSERASFVFISSVMGLAGEKGKLAYCSSKAAIIGGVKSMALELANKKICVNSISPGIVKTEMSNLLFKTLPESSREYIINKHPLGLGEPEDVANLCMFLISDLSKWITGSNIVIDGGYMA